MAQLSALGGRTSWLAEAALFFGIMGFTCLPLVGSVLAIIFGVIGRQQVKKSKGTLAGKGLATAGMIMGIVVVAIVVLAAAIYIPITMSLVGPTRTVTKSIGAAGATQADVNIDMHSGTLKVIGGASDLMDGMFTYNVSKWAPRVSYKVVNGTGNLGIAQQGSMWWFPWSSHNRWGISLSNDIPITLTSKISAGDTSYDLGGVRLTAASVRASAGNVSMDLPGAMNDLKRVNVTNTAGRITLNMSGNYQRMVNVNITNTAGSSVLSFGGRWPAGMTCGCVSTAGSVTIKVPRNVGVRVTTGTSAGSVDAPGFNKQAGVYTNDVYNSSKVSLEFTVDITAGDLTLQEI